MQLLTEFHISNPLKGMFNRSICNFCTVTATKIVSFWIPSKKNLKNMGNSVKERFYEVMEALELNDYRVYTDIEGITKNMMVKLRKGETNEVSTKILTPFLEAHPEVDANYIFTGKGHPLASELQMTTIYDSKSVEKIDSEGIITLYDIEAAANLQSLLADKSQNILGSISIPNIPKCDGAVYVKGDSMYPLLKSGDIVAYKEIPLDIQHIFFGEMYLISIDLEGDEYLTVKYVQRSERGEDWIKLVSYNQYHQPKDFPLSSVRAMALIKLSIRMNTMK